MRIWCLRPLLIVVAAISAGPAPDPAEAQSAATRRTARQPASDSDSSKREVIVEILTGKQGVGHQAHLWRPIFEEFGVAVRIRPGTAYDKIETREKTLGPLSRVHAVGELDRRGRIVFADRSFARSDAAKLGEWLDELKTYGPQGSPEGKPLWGLDAAQFEALYKALSAPLERDVDGTSLDQALAGMELPAEYPLRLKTAARQWLRERPAPKLKVARSYLGFSKGTALAMLLNDYGLGFRPLRTAAATIELSVEPLESVSEVWPVGWEFPKNTPRNQVAPPLFELTPIEIDDLKLVDVLDAVSAKSGVAIRLDHRRIEEKGIDLDTIRVSYRLRQASWSQLLRTLTFPSGLSRELRIDEQGRPFVWITTLEVPARRR